VDLLDGTPVLDVKPVIPYCDVPVGSLKLGWAEAAVPRFEVEVPLDIRDRIAQAQEEMDATRNNIIGDQSRPRVDLFELLVDLLSLDPRHGHQQSSCPVTATKSAGRRYGFRVLDFNFDYSIARPGVFRVESMETIEQFQANKRQKKKQRDDAAAALAKAAAQ
jgi:hypothetical protein